MNSETSDNLGSMSTTGTTGTANMNGTSGAKPQVQRVAQKAHETVDRLEQTLTSSADRVMGWQEEYGEMAREQIRANPLAVVAGAFAVGYLFAKITR